MLTAQEIVDRIGATLKGQQMLFPDPDLVLRSTPFQATGDKEFDRQWLIHWWMVAYKPDGYGLENTNYDIFRSYSNAIFANFTFSRPNGYIAQTNQSCINLLCYRDQPLADHIQELSLWLPYIKLRDVEDGQVQYIKVFEHTLSQYCSHFIYIYPDNRCEFRTGRGHSTEVRKAGTLEAVVDYCRDRHWYEKKLGSYSSDDDEDDD